MDVSNADRGVRQAVAIGIDNLEGAAIRRGGDVWVPGAQDVLKPGDSVMIIGRAGQEKAIRKALQGS